MGVFLEFDNFQPSDFRVSNFQLQRQRPLSWVGELLSALFQKLSWAQGNNFRRTRPALEVPRIFAQPSFQ